MSDITSKLLYPEEQKVFLLIQDGCYKHSIHKAAGYTPTYSYLSRVIDKFERRGLITTDKRGRIKMIFLTEKGKKLKKLYKQIEVLLCQMENKK